MHSPPGPDGFNRSIEVDDEAEPTAASYYLDPLSILEYEWRAAIPGFWVTRTGAAVAISEMSNSHLRNAIRLMRRHGYVTPADNRFYLCGPRPQGEMAMEAFEDEFARVLDSPSSPKLAELEAEAARRGLTREPL